MERKLLTEQEESLTRIRDVQEENQDLVTHSMVRIALREDLQELQHQEEPEQEDLLQELQDQQEARNISIRKTLQRCRVFYVITFISR